MSISSHVLSLETVEKKIGRKIELSKSACLMENIVLITKMTISLNYLNKVQKMWVK